jgi:Uri superfamily endonuclease
METIAEALERFNECMRAKFLEWHIDFLKRRMEKMDIERSSRPKGCRGKIHMRGV